jgi:hypothetical protein
LAKIPPAPGWQILEQPDAVLIVAFWQRLTVIGPVPGECLVVSPLLPQKGTRRFPWRLMNISNWRLRFPSLSPEKGERMGHRRFVEVATRLISVVTHGGEGGAHSVLLKGRTDFSG